MFVYLVVVLMVINLMTIRKLNIIKRCFIIENIIQKKIKKYEKHVNLDIIRVIELFSKIINRLLGLNLKRKRIFKFDLILNKVFMILDYKIKINTKE